MVRGSPWIRTHGAPHRFCFDRNLLSGGQGSLHADDSVAPGAALLPALAGPDPLFGGHPLAPAPDLAYRPWWPYHLAGR